MALEKIKCPNCGFKKVVHVIDRIYVCTYCKQKFEQVEKAPERTAAGPGSDVVASSAGRICPICGRDNSSNNETYTCKICKRPNICKEHIYF